ncbi:hypothetical protein Q7P37_003231 [Cladosporium fusiforme]
MSRFPSSRGQQAQRPSSKHMYSECVEGETLLPLAGWLSFVTDKESRGADLTLDLRDLACEADLRHSVYMPQALHQHLSPTADLACEANLRHSVSLPQTLHRHLSLAPEITFGERLPMGRKARDDHHFIAPRPPAASPLSHTFFPARTSWSVTSNIITRLTTTNPLQAHRIITQVVFTGARVFGRAFAEAYRQASASQKFAAAAQKNGTSGTLSGSGLTLDEACKILNVSPPKAGEANLGTVHEKFKRLFDMNDPKNGGSFYLQSKVLRARERIELEVRERQAHQEREAEIRDGWKPKLYKD